MSKATIVTDVVSVGHAVRLCWLQQHPEDAERQEEHVSLAWRAFYQLPPHVRWPTVYSTR